jgi:nitrate reductase gamma subunit/ferredoxin
MATTQEVPTETEQKHRSRPTPSQITMGIGALAVVVTIGSWITSTVFGFEDDSPVSRHVFGNIPDAWVLVFYTVLPILFIWGAYNFSLRVRNWERGAPDDRKTTTKNVGRRMRDFRAGVYMQTLLRDKGAGLMHSMIYFGFLVLLAVTTTLEIDHQMPESLKFLHGDVYRAYAFIGDGAGVLFVVGILWAIYRRYIQRVYRIRIKSKPEHAMILGTFLVIGLSGFGAEAFRIALAGKPDFEKFSFIGYPLATLVDGLSSSALSDWHRAFWVLHVLAFMTFLVILPITMLRHMFTSPLNMYLRDRERPKGAMKPMPNLMETELESFGASVIEDFTWKQLLDTDACTMCGRCTSRCPAHATGKPLDPREIVLKIGEVMAFSGSPQVSPPVGVVPEITITSSSVFERITSEEVWSCTTCKACRSWSPTSRPSWATPTGPWRTRATRGA